MSTNHTPNYALSLWEASDQVTRTEFNENHAKIDAVLGEAHDRAGMKLIKEAVLTEPIRTFTVSLTDIDWSAYSIVCVDMQPICRGAFAVDALVSYTTLSYTNSGYPESGYRPSVLVWFAPLFLPERGVIYSTEGLFEDVRKRTNGPYRSLPQVGLTIASHLPDEKLQLGTVIRIWGMK